MLKDFPSQHAPMKKTSMKEAELLDLLGRKRRKRTEKSRKQNDGKEASRAELHN